MPQGCPDKFCIFLQNLTSEIRIKIGSGDRGLRNVRIKIGTQSWNRTITHNTTIEPVVSLTIILTSCLFFKIAYKRKKSASNNQVSSDDEDRASQPS